MLFNDICHYYYEVQKLRELSIIPLCTYLYFLKSDGMIGCHMKFLRSEEDVYEYLFFQLFEAF